jgi:hypothetical protein
MYNIQSIGFLLIYSFIYIGIENAVTTMVVTEAAVVNEQDCLIYMLKFNLIGEINTKVITEHIIN